MGTQDNMLSVLQGPGPPVPRPPQVQGHVEGVVRSITDDGIMFTIPSYDNGKFVYGPAKWRGNVPPPVGALCVIAFVQMHGAVGLGKPWVLSWNDAAIGGMPALAGPPSNPRVGQEYWDTTLAQGRIYSGTEGWLPILNTATGGPGPATTVVGPDSFGAAARVGVLTGYARADHDHGLPAAPFVPSPATTVVGPDAFGAASSAGSATSYARSDHDHGLPAAPTVPGAASTVVGPDSFGAAAHVGVATAYARVDHDHGLPAAPAVPAAASTVVGPDSFGAAAHVGVLTTYARGDHDHGLPAENSSMLTGTTGRFVGSTNGAPTYASPQAGDYAVDPTNKWVWIYDGTTWTPPPGTVVHTAAWVASYTGTGNTGGLTTWFQFSGTPSFTGFTKKFATTKLILAGSVSGYGGTASGEVNIGVNPNAAGVIKIGAYFFNALNDHRTIGCLGVLTGIAVGAVSFQPAYSTAAGTAFSADANDIWYIQIQEVW